MTDFKAPVVVGVDGTERSEGALRFAVREARRREVGVHIVHVVSPYVPVTPALPYIPNQRDEVASTVLDAARSQAHELVGEDEPWLPVTTELTTGGRVAELLAAGERGQVLVLGRESVTGLDRLLVGTTTASVAARTKVPLVSVPADWRDDGPGPVVAGFKDARDDSALLAAAFERAEQLHTSLRIVHAWKLPSYYADTIEARTHEATWVARDREEILREVSEWRDAHPDVDVEVRIVHERAARALLEAAREAALLVVVRGRRTVLGPHLGGTARTLLHAAAVPVEIVPPQDDAPGPELTLERSGTLLR